MAFNASSSLGLERGRRLGDELEALVKGGGGGGLSFSSASLRSPSLRWLK